MIKFELVLLNSVIKPSKSMKRAQPAGESIEQKENIYKTVYISFKLKCTEGTYRLPLLFCGVSDLK